MSKLKKFGDCNIKIIGGQIMSRVTANIDKGDESIQSIKVVIPKSIHSDGSIDSTEMPEEPLKVEPDQKKVTEIGDIVMKLSPPYDAAIVDKESEGAIVPSFCAIIKYDNSIDPGYLLAFLNSGYCKDQLKMQVTGSVMTVLSVGKLANIDFPLPAKKKQKEIGDSFAEAQNKLRLIRRIAELESKKNDVMIRELVKDYAE